MKGYDKIKKLSYLKYWDVNHLYGWVISQKLSYNDKSDEGLFLKWMLNILKIYNTFTMTYPFCLKKN